MRVKDKFELVYGKHGDVYNIVNIKSHTLDAFKIDEDDRQHIKIIVKGFGKAHKSSNFIDDNIDKCYVVRMEDYPLPAFITSDGVPVVNLNIFPSKYVSDYSGPDIYCLFLYVLTLQIYTQSKPFEKGIDDHVSIYLSNVFMNLFGKKYGLLGSHKNLIPKLKFLIHLYVYTGMMGNTFDKNIINILSNKYYIDVHEMKLSNDINTTVGFLKSLKENNIIPVTENMFSTTIINRTSINYLPAFEDLSRFFATIAAVSVSGNTVFSAYFRKVNKQLYAKMLDMAIKNAKKGKR